ncbi:MAG: winged helix-turn-helix transcriptional regulator [Sphingobium sp.]|nr:winged helix-turn-helix transcriptional regulator [Sphingobium sp.]
MRQVLFGVLSVVSANPGINQANVGRVLGIARPNMVALVTELTGHGWVERHADNVDRRAFALNLTAAGEQALTRALDLIKEHEEHMLRGLNASDRRTLIKLLARIETRADGT